MLMPVGKRIIVKPVEHTQGTLILTKQAPSQYEVVMASADVESVKPRDIVYIESHHGVKIEHEKEAFIVISEGSILAKIT